MKNKKSQQAKAEYMKDYLNYSGPFYCFKCEKILPIDEEVVCDNCGDWTHEYLYLYCLNCCEKSKEIK